MTEPIAIRPRTGDLPEQVADLTEQFDICLRELDVALKQVENFSRYCTRQGLPTPPPVAELAEAARQASSRVRTQRETLLSTGDAAGQLNPSESVLRFGYATLSYVWQAMEWAAPSYEQSHAVQFFDVRAQRAQDMNYDRNATHRSVKRVESQLLDILGFSPETHGISLVASGMAAFTLLESFLVRDRLKTGDVILHAPYIYYEAWQQLTALPFVTVVQARGYGVEDIIADVVEHRPRVLFVDPVANNSRQRMVDLPELFRRLREVLTEPTTVVVDGTMIAASLPPELLTGDDLIEVIYYESCTKYLQLGLDANQAGLVSYPIELYPRFDELRRNGGAALYRHNAEMFPRYDRAFLNRRQRRINTNAIKLATLLAADPRIQAVGEVFHPGLPDHPDLAVAETLPYANGVVTFLYYENERNVKDELNAVIDDMLVHTNELGVHFTKGVSFGYSVPRVWVQEITDDEPWFLRFNAGDRGHQIELLAEALARAISGRVAGQLAA